MKHNIQVHLCDLPHPDDVARADNEFRDAAGTIAFTYDGTRYSVDVCDEHQVELTKFFTELVDAAGAQRLANSSTTATREQSDRIRKWAAANGYQLPNRGRIPNTVKDAYSKAEKVST